MFPKSIPIIFVGLSVVVAVLVLSWSVFVKTEVSVPVEPIVVDDNNQSDGSDEVIDDSFDVIVDKPFIYIKNDQIFSVSESEFKVLNRFSALELESKSRDCGTNKSEQYFKKLLSHYSENDNGTKYQFKYQGQVQDSGIWVVIVIPNKIGYTNLEKFKNDFDLCEAGSKRYPYLISKKYLFFISSCGTGYDDDSGLPHGCDIVREVVESTIKIK